MTPYVSHHMINNFVQKAKSRSYKEDIGRRDHKIYLHAIDFLNQRQQGCYNYTIITPYIYKVGFTTSPKTRKYGVAKKVVGHNVVTSRGHKICEQAIDFVHDRDGYRRANNRWNQGAVTKEWIAARGHTGLGVNNLKWASAKAKSSLRSLASRSRDGLHEAVLAPSSAALVARCGSAGFYPRGVGFVLCL